MSGTQAPLDAGTAQPEPTAPVSSTLQRVRAWLTSKSRNDNSARRRSHFGLIITLVMLLMIAVFLVPISVVFIGPGDGGVLWKRFAGGTQYPDRPWRRVPPYLAVGSHLCL